MTEGERKCCANCGAWDRSSKEWEHTQWKEHLYQRVVEDQKHDERQQEKLAEERGHEVGRSMRQASCLGLGWGRWGVCNKNYGRWKAILCWDEKRGHHAPLYTHLVTAHDHYCTEWDLRAGRERTISFSEPLREAMEPIKCPGCESELTLYLERYAPTGQEYWKGECKTCKVQWVRS